MTSLDTHLLRSAQDCLLSDNIINFVVFRAKRTLEVSREFRDVKDRVGAQGHRVINGTTYTEELPTAQIQIKGRTAVKGTALSVDSGMPVRKGQKLRFNRLARTGTALCNCARNKR